MKLTLIEATSALFAVALNAIGFTAHASANTGIPGVAEQPATYFYTGKPYDADLGNYTFNARNYNPEINRWTSADPSGFPDGANPHSYVSGRTTYFFDPTGLTGKSIFWLYGIAGHPSVNDSLDAGNLWDVHSENFSQMQDWDGGNPSPNYLSDGDSFTFRSISSLSEIPGASEYSKVYVAIHGRYSAQHGSEWVLGGNIYTTSQIMAGHSGVTLSGCGWALTDPAYPELGLPGGMSWPELVSQWTGEANTHLYE